MACNLSGYKYRSVSNPESGYENSLAFGFKMTNQDPDLRQGKRVLICDDEPRTRQALKTLLLTREITCNVEPSSMISVVGEARDGCEAVQLVKAFLPEQLFFDNNWQTSFFLHKNLRLQPRATLYRSQPGTQRGSQAFRLQHKGTKLKNQ